MSEYKILLGNSVEKLKEIPSESVDCCITSPPYYGLRDYGTGKWEGGDPQCPHRRMSKYSPNISTGHAQAELAGNVGDAIYKSVCPLCGAIRVDEQIGLEETPEDYIARLVDVFREVRRVLKDDGTLWVNIGDSYAGSGKGRLADGTRPEENVKQTTNAGTVIGNLTKANADGCKPKDMIGIPWMLAFALRKDGWYLRQDIIWAKTNCMPEPVKDRCTKSHEYIFLLSKQPRYYFDADSIKTPSTEVSQKRAEYGLKTARPEGMNGAVAVDNMGGRYEPAMANKRDVWSVRTDHFEGAHFATFPIDLVKPMVLAGSRWGGAVLDPFTGSGTTGVVALSYGRSFIGCELNPEYHKMAESRIHKAWESSPALFPM